MSQNSLSRSVRIRLVQAVRESPFAESVEQADLILRTFGLDGLDLESEWQDYDPKVEIRQQVMNADKGPRGELRELRSSVKCPL